MGINKCTYCKQNFRNNKFSALYEKRSGITHYYCEKCFPRVKANLTKLCFNDRFVWKSHSDKGEYN